MDSDNSEDEEAFNIVASPPASLPDTYLPSEPTAGPSRPYQVSQQNSDSSADEEMIFAASNVTQLPPAQQTNPSRQQRQQKVVPKQIKEQSTPKNQKNKKQNLDDDNLQINKTLDMVQNFIKTKNQSGDKNEDIDFRFCMMMHSYLQMAPAELKGQIRQDILKVLTHGIA